MRVLVATDGSRSAALALDLVAGIQWPEGSTVRVVEAIETGPALFGGPWPALALVRAESLEEELLREARDTVEEARVRLARPGLEVGAEVLRGRPATAIVDAAQVFQADLIVIGSRGHGTIESMLLGSVSAEVVDHAPVPILVARRPTVRRLVLGWDGSDGARVAADLVSRWPIFTGSTVRVVSVADIEIPWWTGFPATGSPEQLPMYADAAAESRRAHDELARDMAGELTAARLDAVPELREGDAATEILAAASESQADLIVLGTHGRTGLQRLLLGSVARNVLHHAGASVLVARRGDTPRS